MDVLDLNKKILKVLTLWPYNNHVSIKSVKWILFLVLFTMVNMTPVCYASLIQILYGVTDVTVLIDGIIALIDFLFYIYIVVCFLLNFEKIKAAIYNVTKFQEFCKPVMISRAEKNVRRFTKGVLLYCVVGLCLNSALPLLNKKYCLVNDQKITQKRDPCGLIIHTYFPIDISTFPYFELVYFFQVYCTSVIAVTVLSVTMCLLGLLIHVLAQIKNCRKLILNIFESGYEDIKELNTVVARMNFCIQYQIAIIRFSLHLSDAFSSMMLTHLTMTSLAISVLGYQIIMRNDNYDSLRFSLHLGGWLILLFFTCYYGQKLIDESAALASDAYNSRWYNGSIPLQKNIALLIMRAQRPLMLSAASLGVMSYGTFLQVLKSSYSYLALLLSMTK